MKFSRLATSLILLAGVCWAQGTRTWEQSSYEDFEKGTARGIAISSDGSLALAPAFESLYTSPSTYLWGLAADRQGNVYAAAGSPARVYKLTADGKASIIFAPEELQVQAIVVDPNGAIYAATSPDGKVYKIMRSGSASGKTQGKTRSATGNSGAQSSASLGPAEQAPAPVAEIDSSYHASVFFEPKTKYIWALALDRQGQLYIGTGDRGEIYRVDRNGNGSLFFKSDEAHIRALDFDNDGNIIAGTDGSGLVYRISPKGDGFVLYSAPKKEITALAVDAQGDIFAAGAGEKRALGASSQGAAKPATATIVVPIISGTSTFVNPAITSAPYPSLTNLGGSEVYRISPDGSPKTIWTSSEDLVYALGFDQAGRLLAGTGNRGKIYILEGNQYTDLAQASANQVTAFARASKGGVYAATSNLAKIFLLGPNPAAEGSYESDVFDAKNFSKWGRAEVRGRGVFELFARSGNVDNPDRNWSVWKRVDLRKDIPLDAPSARFVQWKAVLHPGRPTPAIDSVILNYLPKNVPQEVDEVTVAVGARVTSAAHASGSASPVIRDKQSIAVQWKAHDDNDDELSYNVYYRGDGETRWKLLRDGVDDTFVNLDSDMFPDGGYTIRVLASDAPSHSAEDTLTAERTSARFEVDNTPPQIEFLNSKVEGNQVHLTFRASDGFSPIKRAEYSIDAGDWRLIEPVGQISDYRIENYDVNLPIPPSSASLELPAASVTGRRSATTGSEEHTIIIRVYDRFENIGISKTIVRSPAAGPQ